MGLFPDVSILSRSSSEWLNIIYDNREICSKPAPLGYSMGLTTAHLIAFPIYIIAFYTLYEEKCQNFKIYKKYLATHVISNLLFELHLSVVMKPVLYLPFPVVRFTGLWKLSFLNGFFIFAFFYLCIAFTGCINISTNWVKQAAKIVKSARVTLIVLSSSTVCFLSVCITGLFDQIQHKESLKEILIEFPEISCASAIVLPNRAKIGFKPIHIFNISVFVSMLVGTFQCATMGIVSILALREMVSKTNASLRTMTMHKSFLISLFCQIGVHGCMMGFPLMIYVVSIIFHFNGNDVGYVAIILASLHGSMSTLAMILSNRQLLKVAKDTLSAIFLPSHAAVGTVSLVSNTVS